jgi:hypothetical protein
LNLSANCRGVKTLSENLGHSDPQVMLDLNCYSSLEAKRAAVEKIPDLAVESRHKVHDAVVDRAETVPESIN